MTLLSQDLFNTVIGGAFLVVGAALIYVALWVALRVIRQQETINDKLDGMQRLVIGEIHKMDVRVVRLESWKEGMLGHERPKDRTMNDTHG